MENLANQWSKMLLICVLALWAAQVHGHNLVEPITLVNSTSAMSKGAVCLDGSPPAYFLQKGFGEGANNWLVFMEAGAWCYYDEHCAWRSSYNLGSSAKMMPAMNYSGIMTNSSTTNPDFYNWNRVYFKYCDGGSFAGDIEQVLSVNATTDDTGEHFMVYNLTIRGARIFDAVMEDLMEKGMDKADNAMLGGWSAGGLATLIHCDQFRALLPNAHRVKCLPDAGFFVHGNMLGNLTGRENYFHDIVQLHGIGKALPQACTSKMEPHLCIFPENLVQYIKTPVFILQSGFDMWQLLAPFNRTQQYWPECVTFGQNCTSDMDQWKLGFRGGLLKELPKDDSASRGYYVADDACHGYAVYDDKWNGVGGPSPIVNGKTPSRAVGDWYFDREYSQLIENANIQQLGVQ